MFNQTAFDAIVVGSGPNGLAAAIVMQQQGLRVLLVEGSATIGGGMRTVALTLPGYQHDVCSAIHPLAVNTPFLSSLPLQQYGLEFIYPPVAAAHPFDDGHAAALRNNIADTAHTLGADAQTYTQLAQGLLRRWPSLTTDALAPLQLPKDALALAWFGSQGLLSARYLANRFKTQHAKGLIAGMAGHAMQPLHHAGTAAISMVLLAMGHAKGWPVVRGGTGALANAMAAHFVALGGSIETNCYITHLSQLPTAKAVLFAVGTQQLLQIAGHKFSSWYSWQLKRYRYGMGVFKVDWALSQPIPFKAQACLQAGTVHLGGTFEDIAHAEWQTHRGEHPNKPYVLLAQQSLFDASRAPAGKHTGWAYCHVPHGSTVDMTATIENQVERFAPGFKDCIEARHTLNSAQMQQYNPNYIGGDINGGQLNISQLFTRPALKLWPYGTSARGIYICSASTPPAGGVHGLCGYYAAKQALSEVFVIKLQRL